MVWTEEMRRREGKGRGGRLKWLEIDLYGSPVISVLRRLGRFVIGVRLGSRGSEAHGARHNSNIIHSHLESNGRGQICRGGRIWMKRLDEEWRKGEAMDRAGVFQKGRTLRGSDLPQHKERTSSVKGADHVEGKKR